MLLEKSLGMGGLTDHHSTNKQRGWKEDASPRSFSRLPLRPAQVEVLGNLEHYALMPAPTKHHGSQGDEWALQTEVTGTYWCL